MKNYTLGVTLIAMTAVPVLAQTETAATIQAEEASTATQVVTEGMEDVPQNADMPQPQVIEIAPAPPPPPPPPPEPLVLTEGVPIKLAVVNEVNSSTHESGDIFDLTVAEDVEVNDTVVIPKGTPASAEITWRTGKGAFGKSGKLEFALRSINLDQGAIPISGDFRQEGEGNTVATGVGVLAVGVFAGFITGKRARLPVGRELMAKTVGSIPFTSGGALDPEFDSERALFDATADTPLGQCKAQAEQIEKEKKRAKAIKKCYKKRLE